VKVYKAEQKDGISFKTDKFGKSSSLVVAKVKIGDIQQKVKNSSIQELLKAGSTKQTIKDLLGQDQPDLALVVSILVSTGWNLNDDVFTPGELWKARKTPIHKPLNDNHNGDKILGHIVESRALDKDGKEIIQDDAVPEEFDIEVAGVLYREFPEISERINEIISKANDGEMFVSMEVWFTDFSYGVEDPSDGTTKIVARNEETAFLTKHLRCCGGSGQYEGYKIGRVLKSMNFAAQGFVEDPANPDSVIKVAASKPHFVEAQLSDLPEGGVGDVELKELQEKLSQANADLKAKDETIASLEKQVNDFKEKDYDSQLAQRDSKIEDLDNQLKEHAEKVSAMEAEKDDLQKKVDEASKRADKSDAELAEVRKTEVARDRFAKLSQVKNIDDHDATMAELREVSDETFDLLLKYAGETKAEVNDENNKDEDEVAKAMLDDAEVENDVADMNVDEDAEDADKTKWLSLASKLLNVDDTNEGGE